MQAFSKHSTHTLHRSKTALSLLLLVGKELAEEHPGLFREASTNMCFLYALLRALSSAHPEEKLYCPRWELLEGQRGLFQVPRLEEGAEEPWYLPTGYGWKARAWRKREEQRGLSPYCVPGISSVLHPCNPHNGETETKAQRWNLI